MKIKKKDIYYGTKCLCTKFISEIHGGVADCFVGSESYEKTELQHNMVFVKMGDNDYRTPEDLYKVANGFSCMLPKTAISKISMPVFKKEPKNAGDYFVKDLKPYFGTIEAEDKISLKELVSLVKTNSNPTQFNL